MRSFLSKLMLVTSIGVGCYGFVLLAESNLRNIQLEQELQEAVEETNKLSRRLENRLPSVAGNDLEWLALNIYHEARGETVEGMMAVGVVTLNRVASLKYPNTIEEVVKQNRQFSWYWDGRCDIPRDITSWETSKSIARILLINNTLPIKKKLDGVYHYHATHVKPRWTKKMDRIAIIGNHIFYM